MFQSIGEVLKRVTYGIRGLKAADFSEILLFEKVSQYPIVRWINARGAVAVELKFWLPALYRMSAKGYVSEQPVVVMIETVSHDGRRTMTMHEIRGQTVTELRSRTTVPLVGKGPWTIYLKRSNAEGLGLVSDTVFLDRMRPLPFWLM